MSQIAFPLTHAANVEVPFSYIEEATFGTLPASPTFVATKITTGLTPRMDDMEMDVRQLGSHLLYGQSTGGHTYGFGLTYNPINLPFLKYGTEPPNYTTPAGTSAESLQFLMKYKQPLGTLAMTDHYVFWLGCRPNTTTISVSAQQLVEASMEWRAREMLVPDATANGGLTTP